MTTGATRCGLTRSGTRWLVQLKRPSLRREGCDAHEPHVGRRIVAHLRGSCAVGACIAALLGCRTHRTGPAGAGAGHGQEGLTPYVITETKNDGPVTEEAARSLLVRARDTSQPPAIRAQALVSYAKVAAALGLGQQAVDEVVGLKEATGLLWYDAIAELGASALPALLPTVRQCGSRQPSTGSPLDPNATIDMGDEPLTATTIAGIVEEHADAPQSRAAAADLVACLRCGDSRVRWACGHALVKLRHIDDQGVVAKLRQLATTHERAHTRGLAVTVLGLLSPPASQSIEAIDRALGDREEMVRVAAGASLLGLGTAAVGVERDARARAVLKQLLGSKDADIAESARGALDKHPVSRAPSSAPGPEHAVED
jgi:hypothetical protein